LATAGRRHAASDQGAGDSTTRRNPAALNLRDDWHYIARKAIRRVLVGGLARSFSREPAAPAGELFML
jgi:hypothetical protein